MRYLFRKKFNKYIFGKRIVEKIIAREDYNGIARTKIHSGFKNNEKKPDKHTFTNDHSN